MSDITAKVRVYKSPAYGEGEVRLDFAPDYADGRHKEWATATPVLTLMMYVKAEVAEQFQTGAAYTLTFTKEEG